MGVPNVRKNSDRINAAVKIERLDFGGTRLRYVTVLCFSVQKCGTGYFNIFGICDFCVRSGVNAVFCMLHRTLYTCPPIVYDILVNEF